MPVRDLLPAVLRGELGADLAPESRASLETLAHDAQTENKLGSMRDELGNRLKQADAPWGVDYLLAAACALNGDVERAQQTLLRLGEKVAAKKQWEPLAAIAERSISLVATQAAARLLVQAHEGLGKDPERIDALSRAWAIMPEDLELALLLAKRLGGAGQDEDRRALLAELAEPFAAEERWSDLEAVARELADAEDADGLVQLAAVLPTIGAAAAYKEAASLATLIATGLARGTRAGEALEPLRKLVATVVAAQGEGGAESLREAVTLALRQGPGRTVPNVDEAVTQSGLEDADTSVTKAIEQFDAIAALAPGRGVLHGSFGAGRIVSNDTETIVLDFAKSKGHKMPYAAARRTLTPVAEDDLRLLRFANPTELARLVAQEQATMVVGALKAMGGDGADANKLKVFLVGNDLVPVKEWTAFWRKARAACEKDARIDHTRAFEQYYKLAPEGAATAAAADDTPLPPYEVRKPARHNMNVIKKFLDQHPKAEEALKGRFGRFIQRTLLEFEEVPEGVDADHERFQKQRADRARAGLYFTRWYPERRLEWLDVLRTLWQEGLTISDLSGEDEQLALLGDSRFAGVEAEAILSALDSRYAAVRDEAEKHRAELDEEGRRKLRAALIEHAIDYPAAVLRLIEDAFVATPPPADAWLLFLAALRLIEEKPKASTGERILRWLQEGGDFQRLLAQVPVTDEMRLRIRVLLRQWRSSDRYLFPALDAVELVGLAEEKQWVLDHRQRRTERLFSQVGEQAEDFDVPIMTRITWQKLKGELEDMERELRTTIPATIQRARELGDLKENAEYHAAKDKQANMNKMVADLQLRLGRARFVEDAEFREGVVGLGTEVALTSDGGGVSYWILGDGEQHLGDNVISFQAPIGRALMGRAVGDEVAFGEGSKRVTWRVQTVTRRLP